MIVVIIVFVFVVKVFVLFYIYLLRESNAQECAFENDAGVSMSRWSLYYCIRPFHLTHFFSFCVILTLDVSRVLFSRY